MIAVLLLASALAAAAAASELRRTLNDAEATLLAAARLAWRLRLAAPSAGLAAERAQRRALGVWRVGACADGLLLRCAAAANASADAESPRFALRYDTPALRARAPALRRALAVNDAFGRFGVELFALRQCMPVERLAAVEVRGVRGWLALVQLAHFGAVTANNAARAWRFDNCSLDDVVRPIDYMSVFGGPREDILRGFWQAQSLRVFDSFMVRALRVYARALSACKHRSQYAIAAKRVSWS